MKIKSLYSNNRCRISAVSAWFRGQRDLQSSQKSNNIYKPFLLNKKDLNFEKFLVQRSEAYKWTPQISKTCYGDLLVNPCFTPLHIRIVLKQENRPVNNLRQSKTVLENTIN